MRPTIDQWVAIGDAVEAEQRRIDAYRDSADPAVADRLGRWYMDYGEYVSAPVLAAIGMASDDENLMRVVATLAAVQRSDAPEQDGPPERPSRPGWIARAFGEAVGAVGDVFGLGMLLPSKVGEALNVPEIGKGVSRTIIAGMMAPWDISVTALSPGVNILPRPYDPLSYLPTGRPWRRMLTEPHKLAGDIFGTTAIGQAVASLMRGEEVDMGSGFFPAGEVAKRQAEAARRVRGTVTDPWGNEVGWTYGRGAASTFGLTKHEKAYTVTSGLVDAFGAIFLDPVNYISPGKAISSAIHRSTKVAAFGAREGDNLIAAARVAAKHADQLEASGDLMGAMVKRSQAADLARQGMRLGGVAKAASKADPAWRMTVDQAAGLIPVGTTHRPAVVSQQTLAWLYSGDARRLIEEWIPNHHWVDLWRQTDGRVPATVARRLARATTPQERIRVLAEAINAGDVVYLPTGGPLRGRAESIGARVTTGLEKHFKQFNRRVTSTNIWLDPDRFDETAENLWRLTAHFKLPADERVRLLDKFASAILDTDIANRPSAVFKAVTDIEDVFATRLANKGVAPEVAELVTRFTSTSEAKGIFAFDDTGRAVPLSYVRNADGEQVYGPLFITQALREGVQLIDPKELDAIAEELSGLRRVLGPTGIGYFKASKAGFDKERYFTEIGQRRALRRLPKDLLTFYQQKIWKPLAIARMAYIMRVVPEEVARLMVGGSANSKLDVILAILGRRFVTDAAGNTLTRRKFMQLLAESYDETVRYMAQGFASATPWLAPIDGFSAAEASFRRGMATVADIKVKPNAWRTGMRQQLQEKAQDPIARILAAGGPIPAGKKTIGGRAVSSMSPDEVRAMAGVEGTVAWLMDEGRWYRKRMEAMARVYDPSISFDDPAVVRKWVQQMQDAVMQVTGGRQDLLDMVGRGGITVNVTTAGKARRVKVGLDYRFGTDPDIDAALAAKGLVGSKRQYLVSKMLDQWVADGGAPERVPLFVNRRVVRSGSGLGEAIGDAVDRVTTQLFVEAYGKISDNLARSPEMRLAYWSYMPDLIPRMRKAEAMKLVKRAEEAKVSPKVLGAIKRAAAIADGDATLDDVHRVAGAMATDKVRRLFYDATNARNWTEAIKLVAPFANAWWEVLSTWARLLRLKPDTWYQASKVIRGLKGATLDNPEDPNTRGVIWNDPATGQDMFTFPLSGPLTKMLLSNPTIGGAITGGVVGGVAGWLFTGHPIAGAALGLGLGALGGSQLAGGPVPDVELSAPVAALSIGASFLPGLGPVATIAVDELLPDVPEYDDVRKVLMPYGPPGSPEDTLVPGWLDKIGAVYMPWSESARTFMSEYTTAMRVLAADGTYGTSFAEVERLHNDARMTARALTIVRGVVQFIGPAAPRTTYKVEVDEGNVLFTELVRVYGELQQEDPRNASKRFIELFGPRPAYVMASKTATTVGGLAATKEFGKWEASNAELLERYPEVAGFFGPHGTVGEFDFETYRRQLSRGARRRRSPQEISAEAQTIIGRWIIDQVRSKLPADEREWNAGHRELLRMAREEATRLLPLFDPARAGAEAVATRESRIEQLIMAANDPILEGNEVAMAVREYALWRDLASELSVKAGWSPGSWKRNVRLAAMRDVMRMVGADLVERYPDFKRAWDELFMREMEDDAVDEEVLVG